MIEDIFKKNLLPPETEEESGNNLAVLVSVVLDNKDEMDADSSLDELEQLLETAGGKAYCRLVQSRQRPDHATYIGSGKLQELRELCDNAEIGLVVFDCELSPSQISGIEEALGDTRVIDRTMLILDIFAQNARTSEGMLQVQIAHLRYSLPRLTGKGESLSRQGGGISGIGARGPGESKLESDRRHIKRKLLHLQAELDSLALKRQTQRKGREKSGMIQVAVAGYTNAGKSTLLNQLCDESILAENKLFATLDPTTRRMRLPNFGEILVTDTVGFINRLPHRLVEAFKSTLDEIVYSDLILVVMDAADKKFLQKMRITDRILSELLEERGETSPPLLYVLNKSDKTESIFNIHDFSEQIPHAVISAANKEGLPGLLLKMEELLFSAKKKHRFLFPHESAGKVSLLYQSSHVLSVEYEQEGVIAEALCDEKTKGSLAEFLIP